MSKLTNKSYGHSIVGIALIHPRYMPKVGGLGVYHG